MARMRLLATVAACLLPGVALAQIYPSPILQDLTVRSSPSAVLGTNSTGTVGPVTVNGATYNPSSYTLTITPPLATGSVAGIMIPSTGLNVDGTGHVAVSYGTGTGNALQGSMLNAANGVAGLTGTSKLPCAEGPYIASTGITIDASCNVSFSGALGTMASRNTLTSAPLLATDGNGNPVAVGVGTGLSITAGVLTSLAPSIPTANLLGGTGTGFAGISVGTGLVLSAGSLSATYGTAAGTAAQGNDARIVGAAQAGNNLSDLSNAATARTNLGLGTASTQAASAFLLATNNLSDVSAATARTNLGLGSAATKNVTPSLGLAGTDISGNIVAGSLPSLLANQVMGSLTAIAPSGLSVPSCSSGNNALTWTSGVGFGCNNIPGSGGTVTSIALTMPGIFSVAGSPITTSGTLAVTASGTSGGIPYFSAATTLASSGTLAANAPVIGGGAGVAPTTGSRSGNTTTFATASGTLTPTHCVQIDASGNMSDAGGTCTTGSGGGTVLSGSGPQIAQYPIGTGTTIGSVTMSGDAAIAQGGAVTVSAIGGKAVTLNGPFSVTGANPLNVIITGNTTVTLPTSGTLLTTNGNGSLLTGLAYSQLPALTANQLLGAVTATTPAGLSVPSCSTATSALIWTSGAGFGCNTVGGGTVTSVGLSLPGIFTISGSPVTATGTLTAALATETANTFFAGANGSVAAPTFRAIVPADLPVATTAAFGAVKPDNTSVTISGGVISATAAAVSSVSGAGGTTGLTLSGGPTGAVTLTLGGTLAIANGGTGSTSAATARTALGLGSAAITTAAISAPLTGSDSAGNQTSITLGSGFSTPGNVLTYTLPALGANQVLGSLTAVSPTGLAMPSCSGTSNALIWTAGTGFGCNTISGAGTVTSVSGAGGTTGMTLTGGPITGSGTLTLGGTLNVANGGTGAATLTAHGVLLGEGTGAIVATLAPAAGAVLTGNGVTSDPTFQTPAVLSGSSTFVALDSGGAAVSTTLGANLTATYPAGGPATLNVPTATTGALGVVKPDGTTITIASGVISSAGGGGGGAAGLKPLSGQYYAPNVGGITGGATFNAGNLYTLPIKLSAGTYRGIGFNVKVGPSASTVTCRQAIYSNVNGLPGAVLAETSTSNAAGVTGAQTPDFAADYTVASDTWVWGAIICSGTDSMQLTSVPTDTSVIGNYQAAGGIGFGIPPDGTTALLTGYVSTAITTYPAGTLASTNSGNFGSVVGTGQPVAIVSVHAR